MIKPKTKIKEFINFKLKKTKVLLRLQLSSLNFYIFLKYDAHNELYYLYVLCNINGNINGNIITTQIIKTIFK